MTKENNTLESIGGILEAAESVYIFPHILMDGDAMGSAAALCRTLRSLGKKAYILLEDKVPDYLEFLGDGLCTYDRDLIDDPDVCLCIDCGEIGRFPERAETFGKGKTKVCIDHHSTSEPFTDYNYIDGSAAATGEIVYRLMKTMDWIVTKEIAEAIFAAITTDTGNFQYSNTTRESHEIVLALYDSGMDFNKVSVELYQNESMAKFKLESSIMETAQLVAGGLGVIAWVTSEMLDVCNARIEETEGVVGKLRSIKGVQIAMLIKENGNDCIKVAMRAKDRGDVAKISLKFGGGGHVKAAGCTICGSSVAEVRETMTKEIAENLGI